MQLMVYLCFRLDDPSPISDKNLERKIIKLFASNGFPLPIAVVPFRESQGKVHRLTRENSPHLYESYKKGEIEILLHGHSHKIRSEKPRGIPSEFAGLSKKVQRGLIRDGLNQLEQFLGGEVKGFVPPWNSYDTHTLEIMDELQFQFLSGGNADIIRSPGFVVMPATCNLKTVEVALTQALRFKIFTPMVVINFHPDDFEEYMDPPELDEDGPFTDLSKLQALLGWIASNKEMQVVTMQDMAGLFGKNNTHQHLSEFPWFQSLPWRVSQRIPQRVLFKSGMSAVFGSVAGVVRGC